MPNILHSFQSAIPAKLYQDSSRLHGKRAYWIGLGCILAVTFCVAPIDAAAQTRTATSTSLAVTSGGSGVTSVTAGSVVTLTATVNAGTPVVKIGQVNFCDASSTYCTDIHLLGTAQLTSAGTAVMKFRPGIGSHSYKAVFVGTNSYAGSSSGVAALAVTGTIPSLATSTTINQTGSWGNYSLTATVTEAGGTAAPSGRVSFLDSSYGNQVLATGNLGTAVSGVGWPNPSSLSTGGDFRSVLVNDLNGDGIPDLAMNSNGVVIYLGKADGTYTEAPVPSISGPTLGPMVTADFNGDGIPDLALPMYGSPNTTILLGKGDGTFAPPIEVTAPETTYSLGELITADFNGDGIPDLAVIDLGNSTVDIFLGNGDGTFTVQATNPTISGYPEYIVAGDFNRDGKTDIAVGEEGDLIAILLGNGDGTFSAAGTPLDAFSHQSVSAPAIWREASNNPGHTDVSPDRAAVLSGLSDHLRLN